MQFSVQICVFLLSLSFTQREEEKEKKNKNKQEQKNNQPCDSCSLVKKWEPILNARVKTLEVQQLKMRI